MEVTLVSSYDTCDAGLRPYVQFCKLNKKLWGVYVYEYVWVEERIRRGLLCI